MKLFHKHKWEIIVKTYAPPKSNLSGIECNDMNLVNKMFFGCTTILLQCSICRGLRREEMSGKERGEQNEEELVELDLVLRKMNEIRRKQNDKEN